MVKALLAVIVASIVSIGGGVALAHQNNSDPQGLLGYYTKDQCKDGGWQTFGEFKNQGQCVSYFATRKNL